ncbi:heparan-alpha-glucosaminide N-acetyltransferase domain-containing protein [Nocardiopsis chromatogenes]|uniref:heparan-alpha-glucosaminide N-acetyltransferase domain-containing protein n=1 Tax=Nocardiopsis chromatogenes TaxID=280239 RepID=UPI00034DE170|nr:heparan-alpha-glucosaminide N-acetyltransferase domain-containing protein [Nocardiopsis chromatogenes]
MSNSISPSPRDGAAEATADPTDGSPGAPAAAGAGPTAPPAPSGRADALPSPARGERSGGQGPGARPEGAGAGAAKKAADRLVGIDVARGLAVLGMFVVHVGLGWTLADGSNALYGLVSGRSAALFALLAGVSIALLSGGPTPRTGHDMGVALWRVVIRGLIMLPVGTLLTMTGTPVSVILAYYAVFFVLAAPLMSERWKIVAGTAAVLGVLGPVASFYLRGLMAGGGPLRGPVAAVNSYDPLVALAGDGVVNFLLTGAYPAITWMPFVFAGMALGRLRLRRRAVQWSLVGAGAGLAAVAYTASWAALALGGRARLEASFDAELMERYGGASSVAEALREGFPGAVPVNDWAWLLVSSGHSGTPFEVFGAGGIAIAVLGLCLIVAPYLRWAVYPLAAVGALALTTYVGHVLVIWLAESGAVEGTPLGFVSDRLDLTVLVGALVFATVWRLLVRRGPLEWPLHAVSMWAAKRIP